MDQWQQGQDEDIPPSSLKKSRAWFWALLLVLVVAGGGYAVWKYVLDPTRGQTDTAQADAGTVGADGGPAVSLAEGDALLKALAGKLSSSAELLKWLSGEEVIRRLTAAVNLIADGDSPRTVLAFLEVQGPYAVTEKEGPKAKKAAKKKPVRKGKNHKPAPEHRGPIFVSAKSFARYDGITGTFTSVDAAAAGQAYGQLRPYFDAAFAEIGKPGKRFDEVLVSALDRLLGVKFPEGEVELVPKGAVYAYKDPALEGLSAAEKHLLRMGPTNGKAVQASLRKFAEAAALPVKPAAP